MATEDLLAGECRNATGLVSAGVLFLLLPFAGRILFWESLPGSLHAGVCGVALESVQYLFLACDMQLMIAPASHV